MRNLVFAALLLLQDATVEKLIEKLGDDDVEVRDAAGAELVKIGRPALEALRKAAKSDRQEVAGRARSLIAKIDFPEPGPAVNGLAFAIKADDEYRGKITIRGRLINTGDKELVITGANEVENESNTFLLNLAGREPELHLCFRRAEPAPALDARIKLPKGQHVEFTFSPRAWCFSNEHSKCMPVQIAKGEHRLSVALNLPKAAEGAWTGKALSNEVRFSVVE
jgi:hypothetical protein